MDDWRRFRSSAGSVRDLVVRSIGQNDLGTTEEGLDLIVALMARVVSNRSDAQIVVEDGPAFPAMGREWDQLVRDLYLVLDAADDSESIRTWIDLVECFRSVVRACVESGEPGGLRDILGLIETAWGRAINRPSGSEDRQDTLLLRVSELRFVSGSAPSRMLERSRLNDQLAKTFISMIKSSIDAGDLESARIALKYFDHSTDSSRSGRQYLLYESGLTALEAWVLLRSSRGEAVATRSALELLNAASKSDPDFWKTAAFLRSENLSEEFGWTWWETYSRGPSSAGIIQIESFLPIALLRRSRGRIRIPSLRTREDAAVARQLANSVDEIERRSPIPEDLLQIRESLGTLRERLESAIREYDIAHEAEIGTRDLDPSRLEQFMTSFENKLQQLRADSLAEPFLVEPNDRIDWSIDAPLFGLDTLVPRYYFVDDDVYADPTDLAESFAESFIRGEAEQILNTALSGRLADASVISLDQIQSSVAGVTQDSRNNVVVVTNAHLAAAEVQKLVEPITDESQRLVLRRVFDDRIPFLTVIRVATDVVVRIDPAEWERPAAMSASLGAARVHVAIALPDVDEMTEIAQARRLQGLEAMRFIGQVRVRVLERFRVGLGADAQPAVWRLPEDVW